MSIDSKITVSGWVGTQPRHVVTQNGTSFTVFRLGSTKRYFDRSQESWVDGATTWFTVKTWRSAAVNVAESLRRSDPVVVHGALSTEVWESPDGPRTTLVIEADALGPDLTRGQATFRHTVHQTGGEAVAQTGAEVSTSTPSGGSPLDPLLTAPLDALDAAPLDAAPLDVSAEDPWLVDGSRAQVDRSASEPSETAPAISA